MFRHHLETLPNVGLLLGGRAGACYSGVGSVPTRSFGS